MNTTIDEEYVTGGYNNDIYRGGLPGEVYVSSLFSDSAYYRTYKVSFSADTGHTFRHVYISESYHPHTELYPLFMSDRELGVFYIVRCYDVYDYNPDGLLIGKHRRMCVEYYRDYGETHVATYCHDITRDYGSICEPVNNLVSEKCSANCILLTWSEPESSLPVEGYQVFRDNEPLHQELIIDTFYLDENLPNGNYEYYVVTHYTTGCVSDSSNHVTETVALGMEELKMENGKLKIYPNPTSGELRIEIAGQARNDVQGQARNDNELKIENVEVFDVYGRKILNFPFSTFNSIDVSGLQAGIYFVRIATERGVVVRKVVKL